MDDTPSLPTGSPSPAAPTEPSQAPVPAQAPAGSPGTTDANLPAAADPVALQAALNAAKKQIDVYEEQLKAAGDEIGKLKASGGGQVPPGTHASVFIAEQDGTVKVGDGEKVYRAGDYIFAFSDKDLHVVPTHVFRDLFNRL